MTHYISEYGILFTFSVGSSIHIIVSVDLVQEVCTIVNVPESLSSGFRGIRNQLWRGKLTFCFVSEEKLNVCVLEDYKKHKWCDMVIPLPFLNQYPNLKKKNPRIHKGDEEDYLVYIEYTGGKKIVAMFINLIRKY